MLLLLWLLLLGSRWFGEPSQKGGLWFGGRRCDRCLSVRRFHFLQGRSGRGRTTSGRRHERLYAGRGERERREKARKNRLSNRDEWKPMERRANAAAAARIHRSATGLRPHTIHLDGGDGGGGDDGDGGGQYKRYETGVTSGIIGHLYIRNLSPRRTFRSP